MKTNDYLLTGAVLSYGCLFFQQNAGINFLLFAIVMAIIFLARNKDLIKQPKWIWALVLTLASGVGILMHSSALAIIANCISLLLLSALSINTKTSFIFSFLFALYSMASGFVWMVIDLIRRTESKTKSQVINGKTTNSVEIVGEVKEGETEVEQPENTKRETSQPAPELQESAESKHKSYRILLTLAVIVLTVVFFALYKQANPLFAENTKWINLDFLSIAWIGFCIGGFFLLYPVFYHKSIQPIESWENNLAIRTTLYNGPSNKRYETEIFAGILLFVLLNFMLVILNFGDITSLWFNAALPKGVNHSDFVHNGVGVIILSILIAVGLIMYLYHKNYSNYKFAPLLKLLVYLWILQNMLMLFSTAIRNDMYIHDFNFTYRRVGVYVWLCMAAIGLAITFVKVFTNRSNWFLVKSNFALWFTVLSFSSLLNWDLIITRYNIANKPLKDIDFYYLFSLSDSNIPELIEVTKNPEFKNIDKNLKYYTASWYEDYSRSYTDMISSKVFHYYRDYKTDWQSWDMRDERINTYIYNRK